MKHHMTRSQRLAKQAESSAKRKQQEAMDLINKFRDIFDLLCDAIFLGQISSQQRAYEYVCQVRNQRYLPENPDWKERSRLFTLAASQRI